MGSINKYHSIMSKHKHPMIGFLAYTLTWIWSNLSFYGISCKNIKTLNIEGEVRTVSSNTSGVLSI